ncbi:MAG: hypothetical protein K6T83_08185 [Alicyclobacillus sp.]|nr:hypothetical protein [Alicyclobacillus sp.]
MTNQWVVWVRQEDGWVPTPAVSESVAFRFGERLDAEGYQYLIHPRHRNTMRDLVEG